MGFAVLVNSLLVRLSKREPGAYDIYQGMSRVGEIVRDGRPGIDNYPWTWSLINPPASRPAATKAAAFDSAVDQLRRNA